MTTPPDPTPARRPARLIAKAAVQLLLGLGLFGGLLYWAVPSWDEFVAQLDLSVPLLCVSTLGSLFATFVTALRWKLLSEAMGVGRIGYGVYFHYLALTRVVGQFLPMALVDLGRGATLKAAGSDSALGNLTAPIVLERIFDLLLPVCIFGWAIAIEFGNGGGPLGPWGWLALVVVAFCVLGVVMLRPLVAAAFWALARWRRFRKRDGGMPRPPPISPPLATRIMVLSVCRYTGILGQYWGAAAGLGVVLSALHLVSASSLAQLAGLLAITPGGLGFQEGGWAAALAQLGVGTAAIAVVVTATRLMMIVNFGLLTLASWRWRRG